MSPLARVVDEHVGEVAVAAVDGEIDASNARAIGERLRSALSNQSFALVIDLAATTYLDSSGVNLLFDLDGELRQRRQRLHLVVAEGSPVARLAAICGLDRKVPIHPTRDAALDHAAQPDV